MAEVEALRTKQEHQAILEKHFPNLQRRIHMPVFRNTMNMILSGIKTPEGVQPVDVFHVIDNLLCMIEPYEGMNDS